MVTSSSAPFGRKSLGKQVQAYPCKYFIQDGTLYIGTKSIGYYSEEGRERRMVIPLRDISQIIKVEGPDGGVCVTNIAGDQYVFHCSEKDCDELLKTLDEVHSKALTTAEDEKDDEGDDEVTPAMRRSNSDTVVMQSVRKLVATPPATDKDDCTAGLSDISTLSYSIKLQTRVDAVEEQGTAAAARPGIASQPVDNRSKSTRFLSIMGKKKSEKDYLNDWKKLKSGKDKIVNDVALSDVVVHCPFDSFFTEFWSSNAPYPVSIYQKNTVGDKDIKITPWEEMYDGFTMERSLDYMHPNTAPMGPKMARTIKEQQLQKYGKHGMMLHTTTTVEGVPKADCFVLEDRILVEPNGSGESVKVSAHIGIRFVKSTMWRKMIETNSKKGISGWLDGYSKFLISAGK